MPTYSYKCECGNKFEVMKSINSNDLQKETCSKCGKTAMRVYEFYGKVEFKGSGFYCNDSKEKLFSND